MSQFVVACDGSGAVLACFRRASRGVLKGLGGAMDFRSDFGSALVRNSPGSVAESRHICTRPGDDCNL
jgi:hypothetical protein